MTRAHLSLVVLSICLAASFGCAAPAEPAASGTSAPEATTGDPKAIRPFKINVPDAVLQDLKDRLARTRFPDEIQGAGWDYGTPLAYLKELTTYWRDTFDWRAQERRSTRSISSRPASTGWTSTSSTSDRSEPDAMPLVITHGWPGSIAEFTKIIGPLTDPVAHGGRADGRLPRGRAVDARLRLLRASRRERGFGPARDRRRERAADGAPGLHALRRCRAATGARSSAGGTRSSDQRHVRGLAPEHAASAAAPAGDESATKA